MKKIEEYEMGQIQSLVFGALQKSEVCEDATELTEVTPIVLRRMYFKFGEKPTTGILEKYAKLDSDNLTLGCLHCGEDIGTTYSTSWQRIKLALLKEYNPIENYDRIQQDERNVSDDNTHSEGKRTDKVGAQDYDYGATQFTKGAEKITNGAAIDIHSNDVSAFNSSNYEPSARATDDIAQRVEDIDARIDSTIAYTNTVGVRSDEKGAQTNEDHNRHEDLFDSHIHGNIGVTTNMQMILQEVDGRSKMRFLDIIVRDIVKEITLKCY